MAGGQKGLGRGDAGAAGAGIHAGPARALRSGACAGRPCIIVDDVLTTGATLAEAARALRAAGALVRGAVVLAATRPPVAADFGAADPRSGRGTAGVKEKNKPKKDE